MTKRESILRTKLKVKPIDIFVKIIQRLHILSIQHQNHIESSEPKTIPKQIFECRIIGNREKNPKIETPLLCIANTKQQY